MTSLPDRIIRVGIMILIVFSLLSHGAVEAWSKALIEAGTAILAALLFGKWILKKEVELDLPVLFLPGIIFWVISLIQGIQIRDADQYLSLSLDPEATRWASFLLLNLLLVQLIAFNSFRKAEELLFLTHFLIILGTVVSILSLIQMVGNNGLFFVYRGMTRHAGEWLTGPFVNHNHLAGYLGLLVMLPLSFLLTGQNSRYKWLYGFSFVVMAGSLGLTVSRGGIIGFLITLIAITLISYRVISRAVKSAHQGFDPGRARSFSYLAIPVLLTGVLGMTIWIGIEPIAARLTDNQVFSAQENAQTFEGSRGWIWQNSWAMFRANPIFGVGLRAFPTAFPIYADSDGVRENGTKYLIEETHNDYLQVLTDTGIAGGSTVLVFLVLLGRTIVRSLKTPDKLRLTLALGFTGSIIAMLVHSFFDFNLQIPSTSLLFLIAVVVVSRLYLIQRTGESPQSS